MAVAAYIITIGATGVSKIAGQIDPIAKAVTTQTDITTALGVAGGAHDSTPEITTIQTDNVALKAAINGNVVILIDTAVVTTRNMLNIALEEFKRAMLGSNLLT